VGGGGILHPVIFSSFLFFSLTAFTMSNIVKSGLP
jgi:hypothetical protein